MYYIDRNLVMLKGKAPFLEWINSLPEMQQNHVSFEELLSDPTLFLIPDFESEAMALRYVYAHYEDFFTAELEAWYPNEEFWPMNRSIALFQEWFDVFVFSRIIDTTVNDLSMGLQSLRSIH